MCASVIQYQSNEGEDNSMEQKILTSNNDYAKKLLKYASAAFSISLVAFLFMMVFLNDNKYTPIACLLIVIFVFSLYLLIFASSIQKTELTVTNKRVYGATRFGKRVDLPFDSISAVSMSAFKGIAIGTSSGRIVFKGIGNRDDLYATINKLLIDRQEKSAAGSNHQEEPASTPDELKKYKDLLDAGIITQEEFEAKKKQLLGL